eukprot:31374_1
MIQVVLLAALCVTLQALQICNSTTNTCDPEKFCNTTAEACEYQYCNDGNCNNPNFPYCNSNAKISILNSNKICTPNCTLSASFCDDAFSGVDITCFPTSGVCDYPNCVNSPATEACIVAGKYCDTTAESCEYRDCAPNDDCTAYSDSPICENNKCNPDCRVETNYCTSRWSIAGYGFCNQTTGACAKTTCVNTPGTCNDFQVCNPTTEECEYLDCSDTSGCDSEGFTLCDIVGHCVKNCTEASNPTGICPEEMGIDSECDATTGLCSYEECSTAADCYTLTNLPFYDCDASVAPYKRCQQATCATNQDCQDFIATTTGIYNTDSGYSNKYPSGFCDTSKCTINCEQTGCDDTAMNAFYAEWFSAAADYEFRCSSETSDCVYLQICATDDDCSGENVCGDAPYSAALYGINYNKICFTPCADESECKDRAEFQLMSITDVGCTGAGICLEGWQPSTSPTTGPTLYTSGPTIYTSAPSGSTSSPIIAPTSAPFAAADICEVNVANSCHGKAKDCHRDSTRPNSKYKNLGDEEQDDWCAWCLCADVSGNSLQQCAYYALGSDSEDDWGAEFVEKVKTFFMDICFENEDCTFDKVTFNDKITACDCEQFTCNGISGVNPQANGAGKYGVFGIIVVMFTMNIWM